MISTSGRDILKKFVTDVKTLLMDNIIATLQQHYGIWADGRVLPVEKLTTSDASIIYRGRMLRQRLLRRTSWGHPPGSAGAEAAAPFRSFVCLHGA